MAAKSTEIAPALIIQDSAATGSNANEGFVCDLEMLDANAISVLQSIFELAPETLATEEPVSKTASVKFMITMQDEEDLRKLGYSQERIDKIKPQEAVDILQAGTAA